MKFKLNIDRNKEERVEATLHGKGDFSYRLEELVLGYSGEDSVMAYTEDDIKELKYRDIECVTVIDSKTYAIDTRVTDDRSKCGCMRSARSCQATLSKSINPRWRTENKSKGSRRRSRVPST